MRRCLIAFSVLAAILQGCGRSSPVPTEAPQVQVSGSVTLDGQPLADGRITFVLPDGSIPVEADIKDGKFTAPARSGKNRVLISAFRVDPSIRSDDPARPLDNRVNYIPERYNRNSSLLAEVSPGNITFNYAVTSK